MVKYFGKIMLVLAVALSLASVSQAAPTGSALVGGKAPSGNDSLEQEIEGGIKILADGVKYNEVKRNVRTEEGFFGEFHSISLYYRITAPEDTTIKLEAHNMYDNLGHEFNHVQNVSIGGQYTQERFIVGGVPTRVEVEYRYLREYELASAFPRATLSVNGQTVTFRDVPGRR